MTQGTNLSGTEANCVRKTMSVLTFPEAAWRVFTEEIGAWWPLATHRFGRAKAAEVGIEPRVGGRWHERGDDDTLCSFGRVLVWEPPSRLVLTWEVNAEWELDASLQTEVEISFLAEDWGRTRVALEHRHLQRYGRHRDEMRAFFDSEWGWGLLLASFARTAACRHPPLASGADDAHDVAAIGRDSAEI